jgi:hypothetical protein
MPDARAQDIRFHRMHHDAIVSGEEVVTVRWREDLRVGPAAVVVDEHPSAVPLAGRVTSVRRHYWILRPRWLASEARRVPSPSRSTSLVTLASVNCHCRRRW